MIHAHIVVGLWDFVMFASMQKNGAIYVIINFDQVKKNMSQCL